MSGYYEHEEYLKTHPPTHIHTGNNELKTNDMWCKFFYITKTIT